MKFCLDILIYILPFVVSKEVCCQTVFGSWLPKSKMQFVTHKTAGLFDICTCIFAHSLEETISAFNSSFVTCNIIKKKQTWSGLRPLCSIGKTEFSVGESKIAL